MSIKSHQNLILGINGNDKNRLLLNAVKKTLRRKLNPKGKRKRIVNELKGTKTVLEIKRYFYEQLRRLEFYIYAITLNKRRIYKYLMKEKARVYNFIGRNIIDQIPFNDIGERVELIVDRSKSKPEIVEFNDYIRRQMEARIDPKILLDIYHVNSVENGGLQAIDIFSYGIFEKYERKKYDWFNIFKEKVRYDSLYLPDKKERAV